jgi:hypothetical protein
MMEFRSSISRRAAIFCAALIADCALLAPVNSNAQSDQPIVMTCDTTPVHVTLTINLADKTARVEVNDTSPQFQQMAHDNVETLAISQITDQEITMPESSDPAGQYYVLNRYTGDFRRISPAQPNNPGLFGPCQRRQKQF